jgi:LmbE family N-acetylglucosaminyl deacetylase
MPDAHPAPVVLAVAAHPDDIEFMMAGTLLRLKDAGAAIHMWNLARGDCGTAVHEPGEIARQRAAEAHASARLARATWHAPIAGDMSLYYEPGLLARVAAVIREVQPGIILTQSPQDYMEDHMNTQRLVVSAAFVRGMRNFVTDPPVPAVAGEVVIYHALPHGLRDGLRRAVQPGLYVDITPVLARKRAMLAQHETQKAWLDVSQGMDSYLHEMEAMAREVGELSGRYAAAEGWRRHSHLGFGRAGDDPLPALLGPACWVDPNYERDLDARRAA